MTFTSTCDEERYVGERAGLLPRLLFAAEALGTFPPPSPPHTFMKQKPGTMNQLSNVTVILLVPLSFGLEGSGYLDNCLL